MSHSTIIGRTVLLSLLVIGVVSCDSNQPQIGAYVPLDVDLSDSNPKLISEIGLAETAIEQGDEPEDAFIRLASLYQANGFLSEAIACYEGLIEIQPDEPKWKHRLATLISGYGYADDAIRLWTEVIEEAPDYVPARIRLGDAYLKTSEGEHAQRVYEGALETDAKNPYALVGLARIAIQAVDWETAKTHLEMASRNSGGKVGKDLLVTVYEKLGDQYKYKAFAIRGEGKASGSFVDILDPWNTEVIDLCYDAEQVMNYAGYQSFSGDLDAAIRYGKKAVELAPDDAIAHFQLATFYRSKNDTRNAAKHFERAVEIDKALSDAWLQLAQMLKDSGDVASSNQVFYKGYINCPKSPAYRIQYGGRLMDDHNYLAAKKEFQKAIELLPNEARPYLEYSRVCFSLNEVDEGIDAVRKALDAEAGNPMAMTTMCFYSITKKDRDESDYWLGEIQNHPRIESNIIAELKAKYAEAFGAE